MNAHYSTTEEEINIIWKAWGVTSLLIALVVTVLQ